MKPVDVKSRTYIDSSKRVNDEDPKFKSGDILRTSTYKIISAKGYVPNLSEKVFVIKKVKNTELWTYVIRDFKGKGIVPTFYEKELQKKKKKNQKEFRLEKVIKRKGDKLGVKWKAHFSSFNSCIDKKRHSINE